MDKNGNLLILLSNKTNSQLYGWTDSCIGKSLYEVMEQERADRLHLRFNEWKVNGLHSYIAYFDEVGWDTKIEIVNDTLFGIGKKIKDTNLELLSYENRESYNHFHTHADQYLALTLAVTEDSFIIESVDSNFDNDFSTYIGNDISAITFYSSNIIDKHVYQRCIQAKAPMYFLEKYSKDGVTYFFDITIYPYLINTKIFIYAKKIDEHVFESAQKSINHPYSLHSETEDLCVCEIGYRANLDPYIIGCNNHFKKLMDQHKIKLSHIVNNSTFQNCVSTSSSTAGDLFFLANSGDSKNFKINVSYLPKMGIDTFVVVLSPEEQTIDPVNFVFEDLSKREKEVLSYVADGLTNRYIANKLNITEGTVKRTIHNGYKKLGICSRIELLKIIYTQHHG
jgi:DNA-binding CsgD family transcriptional regulator